MKGTITPRKASAVLAAAEAGWTHDRKRRSAAEAAELERAKGTAHKTQRRAAESIARDADRLHRALEKVSLIEVELEHEIGVHGRSNAHAIGFVDDMRETLLIIAEAARATARKIVGKRGPKGPRKRR